MKKFLLLFLSMLTTLWASAYDYQYNGVYYDLDNVNETATVTYASTSYKSYSGTVNIPDYITTAKGVDYDVIAIGPNAFRGSTGLTKVTIATGIETIADNAFYGCSGLTEIKIPNTVTTLGEGAFRGCSKVASVTFSSRLTSLPNYCFYGCSALKTITLPKNLATLGTYCFQGCSSLSSVSFSTVLTNIADYCFNSCSALTNVTLPASVQNVGPYAFQNCGALDNIKLNEGLLRLGYYALANCPRLTEVTLPATVANVGTNLFYLDTALSNAQLSASQLTTLPSNTFSGCSALSIVSLPATLTTIGDYAFSGCSKLPNLTFPAKVSSVASNAFNSCSNLKQLTFAEGMTTIPRTYDTYVTTVTLPNTATAIADRAFYGCNGLASVSLPASVKTIGTEAFSGCTSLAAVTFPKALSSIGEKAFYGNSSLASALLGETAITQLPVSTFEGCTSLSTLTLPKTLKTLSSRSLYGCKSLPSLTLPAALTSIASDALQGCTGVTSLTYAEGTKTARRTYLTKLSQVTLPSTLTSIAANAFDGCSSLSAISLPAKLTTISSSAFKGCSALRSIVLPAPLTTIGTDAFAGCTNLTDLTYAEGTRTALRTGLTGLTKVTIPSTCTAFADGIFDGCTALTQVYLSDLEVWNYLFSQRTSTPFACPRYIYLNGEMLTDLIADFGAPVANYAFSNVKGLKNVTLTATVTGVGDYAFTNSTDLQNVVMGANVRSIGKSAFSGCNSLESVRLGTGVTSLASNAFYGCTSLKSMRMGGNEQTLGTSVFEGCTALEEITLPATVKTIGASAFKDCKTLTAVNIPQGVSAIEANTFSGCLALPAITVPASVTSVGTSAFYGCAKLDQITLPDAVTTIGDNAFSQCAALNYATIGRGIKSIGSTAFGNCTMLKGFYCLATAVPTTNSNAFNGSDPSSIKLYVPDESASAYAAKTPWNQFASAIGLSEAPVYAAEITLTPEVLILSDDYEDEDFIRYTVSPANATNGKVTWQSSNTSVATVSRSGLVSPVAEGVATITCTASDKHGARATALVIIANDFEPVRSIALDHSTLTLTEGEKLQLVPETQPYTATYDVITWMTSDPNVATVNEAGELVAVNAGTCTITAQTSDGTKLRAVCALTVNAPTYASLSTYGDASGDGLVTDDDIQSLIGYLMGQRGGVDASFDINRDGNISIADIAAVVEALKNNADLPAGPLKVFGVNAKSYNIIVGDTRTITTTLVPFRAGSHVNWTTSDEQLIRLGSTTGNKCTFTALAPGQATITAAANDGTGFGATITVNIEPNTLGTTDGYTWVDLGLPSSTRWATCNVGATLPEQYGDYIAWGELTAKATYDWTTYTLCGGNATSLTKYCTVSANGHRDDKRALEADDDAAAQRWSSQWALPTREQMAELFDSANTTSTWTTQGGVYGRKVTSKVNGSSIFLPAAGNKSEYGLNSEKTGGYYATRELADPSTKAYGLNFGESTVTLDNVSFRSVGQSIRPVLAPSVSLSANQFQLVVGEHYNAASLLTFSDGTTPALTWSSSNPQVASVSATGEVTALAAGTAFIYATTADELTVSIKLTVYGELKITAEKSTIDTQETLQLSVNTSSPISWNSSDPSIASVTANGLVTGVAYGSCTITATTQGEQKTTFTLKVPKRETLAFKVNGVTFNMKLVEHGTFQMGQSADGNNVTPVHSVTISQDYYIGETEVTQALWYAVMGQKPTSDGNQWEASNGLGDNYPAYDISWNDCQTFITKLNAAMGQTFRMPTEAEWEFAAKGGNKSQGYTYSGSNTIGDVAWYYDNSGSKTHPVATKAPNELGIYDMSGNVREWCWDWDGSYSSSAVTDPTGPILGSYHVHRGGSWGCSASYCRAAYRGDGSPTYRSHAIGVRLALSPSNSAVDNDETRSFTAGGVTFNMKLVEHGTFLMGSTSGESDEKPVHIVTISQDYYIGETEVTQALWYAVMSQKPTSDGSSWSSSCGLGDNYPAYYISWNDCQTFITKLNAATGQTFRMPTEAEWEFAAKGGNKSQGYTYSGSNTIGDVAWYYYNSGSKTHPVATKAPNVLGIYDMSGNVMEWCCDWYGSYSSSTVTDPTGPTSGIYRVVRDGSWGFNAFVCRAASRNPYTPADRSHSFGFRLALSPSMTSQGPDDSGTDNQWVDANGHEYVDLGLPSGTLWATCNVGADNPEDSGYYFAWGEVEPKSTYNWSTYKWMKAGYSDWEGCNKYTCADGLKSACWYNNGTFVGDNKTELDLKDDAAYMNWGEGWRMPSEAQLIELCNTNNCTWQWTSKNGKNGYLVTSKSNGNSLFLPAAGSYDDSSVDYADFGGYYWSRSLSPESLYAYYVTIYLDDVGRYYGYRYEGQSVRPVRQN